ncbi:hypothetical protein PVAG01_06050 [Phlyctema vagabunda]|uniref:SprT-like domain-containing protein n=1 Tax=Phlyctema vagabunda TaxID=108571 RepID=A0ABR4PEZ1_9HELO
MPNMDYPAWKYTTEDYTEVPDHWAKEHLLQGHLDFEGYSEAQISKAVVDLIDTDCEEWTATQQEGLAMFRSEGHWNFSKPDSHEELKRWFTIFDKIFFNGVLTRNCELYWYTAKEAAQNRNNGGKTVFFKKTSFQEFRHPRAQYRRPFAVIYIKKSRHTLDALGDVRDYLEALLHEMSHAVLFIYSYDSIRDMGTGHGISWQQIVQSIDCVARGTLGLRLCFDRDDYMALEAAGKGDLPNDVELRRLGLDINRIWTKICLERFFRRIRSEPNEMSLKILKGCRRLNHCIRSDWVADVI